MADEAYDNPLDLLKDFLPQPEDDTETGCLKIIGWAAFSGFCGIVIMALVMVLMQ